MGFFTVAFPCETSTLTIPSRLPYSDVAAAYLEAVAGHLGFTADQCRQLGQALPHNPERSSVSRL